MVAAKMLLTYDKKAGQTLPKLPTIMTKQEFDSFLETKAQETRVLEPIDWEVRREEWLDALKRFYNDVELWLKDYLVAGKIQMKHDDVMLEEEHLGAYRAESRVLVIGGDQVLLEPIGTLLIGARGRVDMQGPKGTVKFVLTANDSSRIRVTVSPANAKRGALPPARKSQPESPEEWVWKIATQPPKIRFIDLTAEAFFDALMEVVNG